MLDYPTLSTHEGAWSKAVQHLVQLHELWIGTPVAEGSVAVGTSDLADELLGEKGLDIGKYDHT